MNTVLDVTLNDRMRNYLDTFFLFPQADDNALSSFVSTLSSFHNVIRGHHDKLQVDTLVAIQGFATVIDSVASNVLELEKESEKIRDATMKDISKILDRKMSNLSLSDGQNPKPLKDEVMSPAYIMPSYEWLVLNLHNPYPSREVKSDIARQSKCSVRDIDSWFIDTRKRIGWNSLRRKKFSNRQENIIAAATRFFKPSLGTFTDDLSTNFTSEADLNDEYHAEFAAIEDAARSLYSGRFLDISSSISPFKRSGRKLLSTPSTTSTKGDGTRKRTSLSTSFSQPVKARSESDAELPLPVSTHDPFLSYPTPEPSPGQSVESPSPASVPLPLPSECSAQSRKRRHTSTEPPEQGEQEAANNLIQPRKRFRADIRKSTEATETAASYSLPSPTPTIDSSEGPSECDTQRKEPASSPIPVVLANSSAKRKRRLSDADNRRPTKRPHHALAVPRLQAVSDPFPITRPFADDSFDDWFNGNFSAEQRLSEVIPLPTGLEVQDLSDATPLEVHCHSYDISPYRPDISLPETHLLAHDNVSHEGLLSETSLPNTVLKTSTHETSVSNPLQDLTAAEIICAGQFSLAPDFNFPSVIEETISQDISFNPLDSIINFDALVQPTPVNFNWMQFPLGDSVDLVEPSTSYLKETSSLSDFDSTVLKGSIIPEDQDVKRLRLQFLREELKLLESEIGA